MKTTEIAIIGAGAAGLMCAATAGKRGRQVLVLDHAERPAEKIRISGGGRCNFTNINCKPSCFISQNPHFAKSALSRYTPNDFIDLIDKYRINYHEKTLGQLFCDSSAQQIISMLLSECSKAQNEIALQTDITAITRTDEGKYLLNTSRGDVLADKLVIATGGPSIPKMGSSPFGYKVAEQFEINVIPPRAGLVPLTFAPDLLSLTEPLSGLSIPDAEVSAQNGVHFREGIMFTHRGITGPAILQISSYWNPGEAITINMLPDIDLAAQLKAARQTQGKQLIHNVLNTLNIPKRLSDLVCQQLNLQQVRLADANNTQLADVVTRIQKWQIKPVGTEGYRTAEVTIGGVDTNALSSRTFEAQKVSGLYFIGEVVDVTGHLGGYNFQWAWASGFCCGQEI